jgi:hypothetical protein
MFRHVSLLKLTDPSRAGAIMEALAALPARLPALRDYRVGTDAGLAEDNFDLAIVADFDDAEGFATYRDDPEHQRILAELIRPVLETRAATQYHC